MHVEALRREKETNTMGFSPLSRASGFSAGTGRVSDVSAHPCAHRSQPSPYVAMTCGDPKKEMDGQMDDSMEQKGAPEGLLRQTGC